MGCCGSHQQRPEKGERVPPLHNEDIHGNPHNHRRNGSSGRVGVALGMALVLVAGLFLGYSIAPAKMSEDHLAAMMKLGVEEQREAWIRIANNIRTNLVKKGKYDCCLENPCWYCIQKTPGHGEGAECTCRQDILNGKHPCGECIGEILEGHGLPELKPYFAKAIANEVGGEHERHLQEIIDDLYPTIQ